MGWGGATCRPRFGRLRRSGHMRATSAGQSRSLTVDAGWSPVAATLQHARREAREARSAVSPQQLFVRRTPAVLQKQHLLVVETSKGREPAVPLGSLRGRFWNVASQLVSRTSSSSTRGSAHGRRPRANES